MAYHEHLNHKIYYERHGEKEGLPLIIFNGIMMQTESWYVLLPSLTKQRQVILVDFPDQGRSDAMPHPYNLSHVATRMEMWIKSLNLEAFDLLGISYGGQVAMHLMPSIGHKVKHLILANTTLKTSHRLRAIGEGWSSVAKRYDVEEFFDVCMPNIYSETFYEAHHTWLEERKIALKTLLTPEWFDRFERLVASAKDHDATEHCRNINAHTLVISGASDTLTPVSMQTVLINAISHARLEILQGVGHASMYEAQGPFLDIIDKFLEHE
jgi:3-oxoadipate enol-lactonase